MLKFNAVIIKSTSFTKLSFQPYRTPYLKGKYDEPNGGKFIKYKYRRGFNSILRTQCTQFLMEGSLYFFLNSVHFLLLLSKTSEFCVSCFQSPFFALLFLPFFFFNLPNHFIRIYFMCAIIVSPRNYLSISKFILLFSALSPPLTCPKTVLSNVLNFCSSFFLMGMVSAV